MLYPLSLWEVIGLCGAAVYCLSFFLTAQDVITSRSIAYYLSKLIAASLVLCSLMESYNITVLVLQSFYATVSLYGLMRHSHAAPALSAEQKQPNWPPAGRRHRRRNRKGRPHGRPFPNL